MYTLTHTKDGNALIFETFKSESIALMVADEYVDALSTEDNVIFEESLGSWVVLNKDRSKDFVQIYGINLEDHYTSIPRGGRGFHQGA